jgi:hypothetical protein
VVVADPTPAKVAELLGLNLDFRDDEAFDVLIVGSGPAGVSAAVYAGSEGLSALIVEDTAIGGHAGASSRIENYMGFPTGISGADLVWRGEVQAMKFGTRFAMPRRVVLLERLEDESLCATFDTGQRVCATAVVVATGVQYRRLPIARLEDFEGAGIRRAGGHVPQSRGAVRPPARPRGVPGRIDVALSREPARSRSQNIDRVRCGSDRSTRHSASLPSADPVRNLQRSPSALSIKTPARRAAVRRRAERRNMLC